MNTLLSSETAADVTGQLLRHEVKYQINYWQYISLKKIVAARMQPDAHAGADGSYPVQSVYFDTPDKKDYTDKINGAFARRKIRLRVYGAGTASPTYKLEEKYRRGELSGKNSVLLPREAALRVARGDYAPLPALGEQGARMYALLRGYLYRPFLSVCYKREAFSLLAQDLRVTFDSDLRWGSARDLDVSRSAQTSPHSEIILEVKYGVQYPRWLAEAVRRCGGSIATKSKYTDSVDKLCD